MKMSSTSSAMSSQSSCTRREAPPTTHRPCSTSRQAKEQPPTHEARRKAPPLTRGQRPGGGSRNKRQSATADSVLVPPRQTVLLGGGAKGVAALGAPRLCLTPSPRPLLLGPPCWVCPGPHLLDLHGHPSPAGSPRARSPGAAPQTHPQSPEPRTAWLLRRWPTEHAPRVHGRQHTPP